MKVFITSYAHCEKLNIKPNDSIINTVIDTAKPNEILAFERGHAFSMKDDVKPLHMKHFIFRNRDIEIVIFASKLKTAKMLLKGKYAYGTFTILQKIVYFEKRGSVTIG